jgi:hypothetical protein
MWGRPDFSTEFIGLSYVDLTAAKQWWMRVFRCKETAVPDGWDDSMPTDVALILPGAEDPTILPRLRDGVAGVDSEHPLLFCGNLSKAHDYLSQLGAEPGPMQEVGGKQFFEVIDPEGHAVEICE